MSSISKVFIVVWLSLVLWSAYWTVRLAVYAFVTKKGRGITRHHPPGCLGPLVLTLVLLRVGPRIYEMLVK